MVQPLTSGQATHFVRQGFFFLENPFGQEALRRIEQRQTENEPEWAERDWPAGFNIGACQFFMVGEPLLALVEKPQVLAMARQLLGCDDIHVGACGLGDASKTVSADGRPQQQVHWHADGSPDMPQVSLRTALDRHGPDNAPLRLLPGSHQRPRDEVAEELRQIELASGCHEQTPTHCFAAHPQEVAVHLDPHWTLVWTPSAWHATGVKTAAGPRRAMAWNYFPAGGRKRDLEALKHLFAGQWEKWTADRKRLWGLL